MGVQKWGCLLPLFYMPFLIFENKVNKFEIFPCKNNGHTLSIIQIRMMSVRLSVCPFVRLKLKISETAEPIGFYSSGNILTGPMVVLGYFLVYLMMHIIKTFFNYPLGLESRGKATSNYLR